MLHENMIWSYEASNTDERQILDALHIMNPVIVTDVNKRIIGVSRDWVRMCQYTSTEAFGESPTILQGQNTNIEAAKLFATMIQLGNPTNACIINYKKDGTMFLNYLYGYSIGDLLVAETYAEQTIDAVCQTVL